MTRYTSLGIRNNEHPVLHSEDKTSPETGIRKRDRMRTLLGTMNEEIEKMKKAVNIDYAPVTLDKSDKKVGLSFL